MTKINIISIDLGDPIEAIISDDIRKLSEETIEHIKAAADEKAKPHNTRNDKETAATEAAYKLLFDAVANKESVEIDKLLAASSPAVTNPSSLMMRMKHLLRQKGNEYVLHKNIRNGKPVYRLMPYNLE